jgi:hypothetical protein
VRPNETVSIAIAKDNLNTIIFCNTSPESYTPACLQKDCYVFILLFWIKKYCVL